MALTLEEQETNLNMVAIDRTTWHVFTDDPVMQRKLERIGAVLVRENLFGGKEYTLRADQVLLRKGKRKQISKMTEEQRAKASERMKEINSKRRRTELDTVHDDTKP